MSIFIGGIFVAWAFIQFYNVFLNKGSAAYLKNAFFGGGFKTGFVYPVILYSIGYFIITEDITKAQKKNAPIETHQEKPIVNEKQSKHIVEQPIEMIKKYIQENQKRLENEKDKKEFLLELDNEIKNATKEIEVYSKRKLELLEITKNIFNCTTFEPIKQPPKQPTKQPPKQPAKQSPKQPIPTKSK